MVASYYYVRECIHIRYNTSSESLSIACTVYMGMIVVCRAL